MRQIDPHPLFILQLALEVLHGAAGQTRYRERCELKIPLQTALADKIDDHQVCKKGIDASWRYEGYATCTMDELNGWETPCSRPARPFTRFGKAGNRVAQQQNLHRIDCGILGTAS